MPNSIKSNPAQIHEKVRLLEPGLTLKLGKGRYAAPIVVSGCHGTQAAPIVIKGKKALIGPGLSYEDYRLAANELSAVQEAGGRFPGVYYLADNAALVLRDCQWIVIEDLSFDGCWPTAIYLDNCQHITLRGLSIRGGTIAIGATGANTRHLMIEDCDWIQDTSGHGETDLASIRNRGRVRDDLEPNDCRLWRQTYWEQVHGNRIETRKLVDVDDDARAFDGDFFRAWTIAGYVILRRNVIIDAFNAIHFFNQAAKSIVDNFSRNVVIEGNWFVRIRDNAVEPEDFAWNWTVRHNKFVDCYIPFSLEMERSGFFYVYGNLGWNLHRPGPDSDKGNFGQLFKFPPDHQADGPHYVFHNSWILRGPICKKLRFSSFFHVNNAIGYYQNSPLFKTASASPFGPGWNTAEYPSPPWSEMRSFEKSCFTKSWTYLDIQFDGDVVDHPHFPQLLQQAGYSIGPNARQGPLSFANNTLGLPDGLKLQINVAAVPFTITLPDGRSEMVAGAGQNVGAWHDEDLFRSAGPLFYDLWPEPELARRPSP